MEAVILAGGLGTRLRPLTYTRPKSLLPILNKPMLQRFIESLPREVSRVIIPISYLREMVDNFLRSIDLGKEIITIEEKEPLGTGGAVKNVEKELTGSFLVLNVDVISSINLSDFIKFHKAKRGIGTISLWEVENPEEFGIVALDNNKKILRFKEKPKKEEIFSKLVNAGAYALELEILDHIPRAKFVSMEREIFPKVLDKCLYGYEFKGYWLDTGRPEDYINAHKILLENIDKEIGKTTKVDESAKIETHVLIGENCRIAGKLKAYSCLGNNVEICENAIISKTVIMDSVKVENNTKISNTIIGENCKLGKNCILVGCVLGDGTFLENNTQLLNAKVHG
jgi:mannose-1-phosphate guanylyltransferase